MSRPWKSVVALSGGVGGARLLDGLAQALPPGVLTALVNTGDDFEHWGMHISPDLDTVMYTLSGLAHEERGWGLADESFRTLEMVRRYGGDDWFALGDRDLGTHIARTTALKRGDTLSAITNRLNRAVGVTSHIIPMADGACRTMIETAEGALTFQDWFVRRRASLAVRAVRFEGDPNPAAGVIPAIRAADAIIIGPSNPYVSVDPILTRVGVREAMADKVVIAVSPIVGGKAIKGPLATMIPELTGRAPSAAAIGIHYGNLLKGLVVEQGDAAGVEGVATLETETVMQSRAGRKVLAETVLQFAERLLA
jgi:LPPG:FO 2-phospho-L-lactate transferase